MRLWCGDFFGLQAAQLGSIDAVYDRAALIALPAAMRASYAQHLQTLVGVVPHLLVTLEYPQDNMDGPPFSVEQAEVEALFGERYAGTRPHFCEDVLGHNSNLQQRGLERLNECVYLLQAHRK